MNPSENTDVPEVEFRHNMLVPLLESEYISDIEALPLHMWLSDQVSHQLEKQALSNAVGQSIAEQIKTCTKLMDSAYSFAEQFSFPNQISALDIAMSQVFRSDQQMSKLNKGSSSTSLETWIDFRERMATDSAKLLEVSRQVLSNLREIEVKRGRPTKECRSKLFSELDHRLVQISSLTRERRVALAADIWNIYFPDDVINEPETAARILSRVRNGHAGQGHISEKSD